MAAARHIRFAQEYAVDLDGTAAAIRAGYSKKGAAVTAHKLLKRPAVKAEIKRITDASARKVGVKLERVIEELAHIAFVDPADFYDKKGNLLSIKKMPESARRALHGFDVEVLVKKLASVTKVRFEKRAALHDLLEHLSPRRLELTGKNGKPLVPPAADPDWSKLSKAELFEMAGMKKRAGAVARAEAGADAGAEAAE
ncbi:MAG: terminase small subunit [Elusimicrobia bacterium]|nr:terminase small subunit [Elusimicrobiota bacterium]